MAGQEQEPLTRVGFDESGRVGIDLGVTGVPETFVIDRTGRIRYRYPGPLTEEVWRENFEPLLKRLAERAMIRKQIAKLTIIRIFAIVLLSIAAAPSWAVMPDEVLQDPALESRARVLSQELRCVVCQNQSIDDSNAPLAHDLRVLLRDRLTSGDSDQQALDFIVARYGQLRAAEAANAMEHAPALDRTAADPLGRRHRLRHAMWAEDAPMVPGPRKHPPR